MDTIHGEETVWFQEFPRNTRYVFTVSWTIKSDSNLYADGTGFGMCVQFV